MKNCKVLIGPIAGNNGIIYNEGESLDLDDATAVKLADWGYVQLQVVTTESLTNAAKAAAVATAKTAAAKNEVTVVATEPVKEVKA